LNSYSAYGLSISSEIELPELQTADGGKEIQIRLENDGYQASLHIDEQPYWRINRKEAVLSFGGVGTFHILEGREIAVMPASNANPSVIRQYIIGTVMAILLYQRGYLVLHASSVLIGVSAIVLVGIPGSGKSSIAAAMSTLGYDVITDDVAVIDTNTDPPSLFSGHHQIRLRSETAEVLGYDLDEEYSPPDIYGKYCYQISNHLPQVPVPLAQIYSISEGTKVVIKPLSSQSAVIDLVLHSIPTRWSLPEEEQHFTQCVNIAKRIPLFSLERGSKVSELPELAKLIVNNYYSLTTSPPLPR